MAADKAKLALAAVFDVAPNCIDAKLLQADLMLDERDYGGQLACLSYTHACTLQAACSTFSLQHSMVESNSTCQSRICSGGICSGGK